MAGYRQKWLPPPTIDDYMWEVQQNIWWQNKDRARRQLIWMMEQFLGDNHEKATFSEISGCETEEGEDVHYYIPSE
jgi:hypothetical protein